MPRPQQYQLLRWLLSIVILPVCAYGQGSYFNMSTGDYSQTFDDIASWTTPTTNSWQGLATNATGTIPSATRITAASTNFVTGASGGVQKGTANLQLLSTGGTDNSSATAIDLLLNFAGRNAGNLSFDAATVFNSTGNRAGTLRVYYSTNGAAWAEIIGGGLPYVATNNAAGSSVISNALPAAINNAANTQLRFYYNNGGANTNAAITGSRPKISVDNVLVTSTPASAGAPVITSATTDSAVAFQSYSYQITASNSPTSFAASNLPTGFSVNASTGLISGTPTATGVFPIPIFASNAEGTGGATLTLTVTKNPGAPTITSALTATGDVGGPFSYQISADNTPTSYSSGTLPSGLSLDTGTGLISGAPTVGGTFNVSITASNSLGSDTKTLAVTINSPPVITSPLSGSLYATSAFGYTITASFSPTSFGASGLPSGWSLDTATGVITSGVTPLTLGSTSFQISATNSFGAASNTYTLAVYDQTAQNAIPLNVLVNKYVNAAVDKVQLLVVGDNTPGSAADLRGMIVKDFSTSMANDSGGKFLFTTNALWSSVRAGTFIALSAGSTQPEDVDPADFYLAVNLGNTNYFVNGGGSFDISTTDMLMVKQAGSGVSGVAGGIHALAGGTAGAQFTTFTGAKLLTSGTSGTELGVMALNSSSVLGDYGTSGAAASTNAQGGVAAVSLNFASWNNASNQAYVESLRTIVPVVSVSPSSIAGLTATQGAPGASTNFTASGSNLSNNVTVTANDAVNFAISTNNTDFTSTITLSTNASGAVSNTPVYVRLTGTNVGSFTNTVSLASSNAATRNVTVSGTVTSSGSPAILANPTSLGTLVAYTGQPGTAQSVAVTGQSLPGQISLACDSNEYEVANAADGNFGVAATLPAGGGTVLVRLKAGATTGVVASAIMVLESGTGAAKVSTSVPIAGGTRISGGTGGLEPGLQTFGSDLNFTATARFTWVLKGNTVDGRGTNFSGVNVGGNLGVAAGAAFDLVFNGASSTTDFANPFWQSARSWLVFNVTGNTTGSFTLGAITPDSGGKYYAGYGSFGLRTDAGGDVYLDWTPGSAPTGPVISVGATSLNLPGTTTNIAGNSTNFTVSGASLTGNITVTALDAVNFAVSTNSTTGFAGSLVLTQSSGAVSSTPVYVRLTGTNAGTFSNTVTAASPDATTRTVAVSGTVTNLNAPAINISTNALGGFATQRGTPSASTNLTVTGTNLSGSNIAVTSSNNFYEISTNSFATAGSNTLTLASTGGVVAVRISTNAPATNSLVGNLALSGGGATNNVALSGVVTNPPAVITVSTNSLPAFSSTTNVASAAQSFTAGGSALTANITVAAPTGFQVAFTSNNADFGTAVTLTNSGGTATNREVFVRMSSSPTTNNLTARNVTLTTTGGSNQVSVSGTITAAAPSLTASPSSLTNFFTVAGTPSVATNYTLRGSNLTTNVAVSAPAGFQVALTNTNSAFTNTLSITNNGSISNNIWVRVATNATTNTNLVGNITNTAGTAVTNVSLQARVVPVPTLAAVPTALSNFTTISGIASTNQSFNLTASNLLGPVNLSVTNGYEISLNPTNGFSTSLSVSLVSAADNASNYGSGSTNTTIAYVGSEAGSPVQNWSDPIVAKSYTTGGNLVYGTAGYYQIRPTPSASPSNVEQSTSAGNDLGVSATNNPTLYAMPSFASSVAGGAGNFVNFGPYPVFSGPSGSVPFRQGALSVSVNAGPFDSPAGTNASYFGVPFEFTMATSGRFRIGVVVDAVADGTFSPNYVSLYSPSTGTVFSAALVRDGTPDMVFFDVTAQAGDTFNLGLWQNTGTQSVAALSLVTFDNLPATAAGWANGANGGTGFGPWTIAVDNNPPTYFAGAFVGDPTFGGITGFGTNAFGLYANPAGTAAAVSADRPFSSPLKVGETFSFQWAVNWDAGGGNKGFNVYSGGAGGTQLANVNQGNFPGNITFNGVNAITNFGTGPMTWSFTMTSMTNLLVTSTARDGSTNIAFTTNIAVSGAPDAARWYTTAMTPGDQRQSYFNNLQIAYASTSISNLPVYVRLATNAPVSEDPNSLLSRVSIATPANQGTFVSLSGDVIDRPSVTVSTNSITNLITTNGYASAPTNFTVTGRNLSNNVTLTVAPTNDSNFEISTNGFSWTNFLSFVPTDRLVSNNVLVRITQLAPVSGPNELAGFVTVRTDGALFATNVSLLGTVLVDSNIPTVSASTYDLSGLGSVESSPGPSTNFSVSGMFLRGPITVTAGNSFLAVSADNTNFGASVSLPRGANNDISNTPVYVRITEFAPVSTNTNAFLGNLLLDTTRNSNNLPAATNVAVSGTVTNWSVANPFGIRVTNPPAGLSTEASSFLYRGQIGSALSGGVLRWLNVNSEQSNFFTEGTNGTWSASVPLASGNNMVTFSGQYVVNAGPTNVAFDSPADEAYANGWGTGDSGGDGFGPWQLVSEEGLSRLYIANIWDGMSTNMNVSGFYGFALEAIVGGSATAYRPFLENMQAPGGSFAVYFDSNDVQPGGSVGLHLVDSNRVPLFTFAAANDGSGPLFTITDIAGSRSAGWTYSSTGFLLQFSMAETNRYELTSTATNAGVATTNTNGGLISAASPISGVVFFDDSSGAPAAHNFYVGAMQQTRTLYRLETAETVAPDVERLGNPGSAYDLWAQGFGLDPSGNGSPGADPDMDSFSNELEYAFGTSPIAPDASLLDVEHDGASVFVSYVARKSGVGYALLQKRDLADQVPGWADTGRVPSVDTDQTGVLNPDEYVRMIFSAPAAGSRDFYRVRATITE